MRPSFTLIISGIFIAYILHSIWNIYQLYNPSPCPPDKSCIKPSWKEVSKFQLILCTSVSRNVYSVEDVTEVWKSERFDIFNGNDIELDITLPQKTRRNGSIFLHAFLTHLPGGPRQLSHVFKDSYQTSYEVTALTKHIVPRAEAINLLGSSKVAKEKPKENKISIEKTVTHWKPKLALHVMSEPISLFMKGIPSEITPYLRLNNRKEYLPILFASDLGFRMNDLVPLNKTHPAMHVVLAYTPITFGRFRLMVMVQQSMKLLQEMGFSEKDTDEIKGIFFDTSIYLLLLTFFVSAFHLLFDVLAFKNDISFWRHRKTMIGLSFRGLVWRCVSQSIVFLYLLDQETSLLVLVPSGIGAVIELWKVSKAMKLDIKWDRWKPRFEFGTTSEEEKQTDQYDSQSMKYLSYVLYPLCFAGAVYSLLYVQHKSWYSWCIQSCVNGVYAFGFIFMLPQLFVNYKLKSVAHLPWRAFMYKAFNTFIDDLFAFIITMPTAHRVACFRDDVVFLIYLYQRWLYPVDKTRVNEYGESYEVVNKDKKD